jgi:hypothetical protein
VVKNRRAPVSAVPAAIVAAAAATTSTAESFLEKLADGSLEVAEGKSEVLERPLVGPTKKDIKTARDDPEMPAGARDTLVFPRDDLKFWRELGRAAPPPRTPRPQAPRARRARGARR